MKVQSIQTSDNNTYKGTLKIYDCGGQFNRLKEDTVDYLEKNFAERTQGIDGHMDVFLFSRISNNRQTDKVEYLHGSYVDNADIVIKNCNADNKTLNRFIDIFSYFKNIQDMKNKIGKIFT